MREQPRKPGEPNRDPISGAPGAHPVGTIVGAAIGAVAGGLAGKGVAEMVDPTEEDAYWRENHRAQPYYEEGRDYDAFAPAYRLGYEGRVRYDGRAYDDIEQDLAADYERFQGNDLTWEEVRPATRAAWDRVDQRIQTATRN